MAGNKCAHLGRRVARLPVRRKRRLIGARRPPGWWSRSCSGSSSPASGTERREAARRLIDGALTSSELAGKLNFYLSAVDDLLRHADDAPTIGLLLCKGRNKLVVEYALRDMVKPMGVSEYHLTEALPESLKGKLPTVEELEAELEAAQGSEDGEGSDDAE